nr:DUF6575 domain-containing protein [Vibrio splendidus]
MEVYEDFLGPKCFSVKNENTQRYMVYWSGNYDEGQCIKWAYIPVTKPLLARLLNLPSIDFEINIEQAGLFWLCCVIQWN